MFDSLVRPLVRLLPHMLLVPNKVGVKAVQLVAHLEQLVPVENEATETHEASVIFN